MGNTLENILCLEAKYRNLMVVLFITDLIFLYFITQGEHKITTSNLRILTMSVILQILIEAGFEISCCQGWITDNHVAL